MKMNAPDHSGGLTVGGKTYEPDADNAVEIDADHVVHALSHGFTPAPEPDADDKPAKKKHAPAKA